MRHLVRWRPRVRGVTPRRLAAAKRALKRQRDRLPLFADQVSQEQETPEERIERFDLELLAHDQRFRALAAKHWRWGRRLLRRQTTEVQQEILAKWNRSPIPPDAAYFADFVRRELRNRGLTIQEEEVA